MRGYNQEPQPPWQASCKYPHWMTMGVENTNLKRTQCALCDESSPSADGNTFVDLIDYGEHQRKQDFSWLSAQSCSGRTESDAISLHD